MYQEATQRVGRASVLESPLRSARASAAAAAAASRAAEEQHTVRAASAAADPGKAADAVSCNPEKSFHDLLSAAFGHACRLSHLNTPKSYATFTHWHAMLGHDPPVALPKVGGLGSHFILTSFSLYAHFSTYILEHVEFATLVLLYFQTTSGGESSMNNTRK